MVRPQIFFSIKKKKKTSIYEKEKTKLEGDAPQDKKRKELLKKYGKANKSLVKDSFVERQIQWLHVYCEMKLPLKVVWLTKVE